MCWCCEVRTGSRQDHPRQHHVAQHQQQYGLDRSTLARFVSSNRSKRAILHKTTNQKPKQDAKMGHFDSIRSELLVKEESGRRTPSCASRLASSREEGGRRRPRRAAPGLAHVQRQAGAGLSFFLLLGWVNGRAPRSSGRRSKASEAFEALRPRAFGNATAAADRRARGARQ